VADFNNEFKFDVMRGPRGTLFHIDPETSEMVVSCECCGEQARQKQGKLMSFHLAHEPWCPMLDGPAAIVATVGGKIR
jgi:hypothetical protein